MKARSDIEPGERGTVDRIEGRVVVVELAAGDLREVPRRRFRGALAEGDVVIAARDGYFSVDREATRAAREHAEQLVRELSRRDPGGDIVL